ncbi:MAG: ABC transporter substrate-binding protein [Thermodesulfobacteriota bacterium]
MDAKKTENQDKGILNKEFSRRDFLKTTALGAAGLSLSSWAFTPFTYAAEKPIKIGMIQELTVGATEYGYWLDKVGKAAIAKLNAEGGIAGRKVELIDYDTKCNPAYGAQMFKKLVLEDKVDFIMGSVHSGIQLACFPIAEQYKIPYFGGGAMASALTGKGAIPYYIRIHTHATMQAMAGVEWGFKNLGKKWGFLVADYAWGHSLGEEFGKRVKALGGKIQEIRAPQTTKDFVPFLQKIDPDIDVLFTAFLNPAALGVMRQTVELGLQKRMKRYTVICCTEGIGQDVVGKESAGAHYIEYSPRFFDQVPKELQPYEKAYRQAVGVTDDGRDTKDPKITSAQSHMWSMWTSAHMIKQGVEQTGWKDSSKNADFIKAVVKMKLKAGPWTPQGELVMRAEDHQGFHDHYISEVTPDLKLKVLTRIPKEKLMYDPMVDLRTKI